MLIIIPEIIATVIELKNEFWKKYILTKPIKNGRKTPKKKFIKDGLLFLIIYSFNPHSMLAGTATSNFFG